MTKTDYASGDINSKAKGTGARANSGKISFALFPLQLLGGCIRVWMGGLLKYAHFNWAKGMRWSIPFDCTMRHLIKFWYMGEEIDPESGEHHLDMVMANLLMLKHFTKTYADGDDRPGKFTDFALWLDDFNTPFDEAAYLARNPEIAQLVAERDGGAVEGVNAEEVKADVPDPRSRDVFIREVYREACVRKNRGGVKTFTQSEIDNIWLEGDQRYIKEKAHAKSTK